MITERPSAATMFSSTLVSRILTEAQSRGLVGDVPQDAGGAPSSEVAFWGAHMASLVDSSALPKAELNSLAWDAIGREAGSWLDPFFKGPAPVGDLPGLGDRYRDLERIGEGASGKVYKALDTLLLRHVAIKVLNDPDGPTLVEARAQAQVEHPNVCRIYEAGKGFLVMQLVEGPRLAQVAPSLGRDDKVRIIRDIALGVHAAHQKGLVHLDLKLNNVLLDTADDGTFHPVVSDFGMVRGEVQDLAAPCPMGTPPYTSPEQLAGDIPRLGRSTDVYALGVMLYVLLTGRIPFEAHDFQSLLDAMAHAPPVPLARRVPDLPRDLGAIVHRCLAKNPAERYPTARDLADDLEQFLQLGPVQAMGGTRFYRMGKWVRRNPTVKPAGVIAMVVLLAMAGLMIRHDRFVTQQSEWDHHFQKILEAIRTGLDQAYRLPAHNIEPELHKAQGYLHVIESDLAGGGAVAKGPGLLALGQAHYLLDPKDPQVVKYLQEAWDSGYQVEGVRSWLALAWIHRSRMVRRAGLLPERDRALAMKREKEAFHRAMDQARRLLRGRWSPDQARLAHLVELADAGVGYSSDLDLPIRLAHDYLDQFPNDLDGMLEEADAIANKADSLAFRAAIRSTVQPPICSAEVEPLRQKAWAQLQHVLHIAPSHPAVYAAMARWWMRQEWLPTERSLSRAILSSRVRAWLDEGRKLNPNDLGLISLRATFICSQELPDYLQAGRDPVPLDRELKELFLRAGTVDSQRGRMEVLTAMASYSRNGWVFGFTANAPVLEALHLICRNPPVEGTSILEALITQIGRDLLETGGDPGPILGELLVLEQAGQKLDESTLIRRDLILAEHAWLAGRDATGYLAKVPARLQKLDPNQWGREGLELAFRKAEAEIRADEPAWARLAACLQRLGTVSRLDVKPHLLWASGILLARHLQDMGHADPSLVQGLRESIAQSELRGEYPGFLLQYYSAPVSLMAARLEKDPRPRLMEGLAACEACLDTLKARKKPGNVERPTDGDAQYLVIPGRLRMVEGEFLLALARLEARPALRAPMLRRARVALRASREHNRNLNRLLAPLLADAEALAKPKGEIHAHS